MKFRSLLLFMLLFFKASPNSLPNINEVLTKVSTKIQSHDFQLADHESRLNSNDSDVLYNSNAIVSHEVRLDADELAILYNSNTILSHDTRLDNDELAILYNSNTILSHDTRLDDDELAILYNSNTIVSHNARLDDDELAILYNSNVIVSHEDRLDNDEPAILYNSNVIVSHEVRLGLNELQLYGEVLLNTDSIDPITSTDINCVAWSHDGLYLAVARGNTADAQMELLVYELDQNSGQLTYKIGISKALDCNACAWAPSLDGTGKYQLVAAFSDGSIFNYTYNGNVTLTQAATIAAAVDFDDVNTIAFRPDPEILTYFYISAGGVDGGQGKVKGYRIIKADGTFSGAFGAAEVTIANTTSVNVVAYTPDGLYLGVGCNKIATDTGVFVDSEIRVYRLDTSGTGSIAQASVNSHATYQKSIGAGNVYAFDFLQTFTSVTDSNYYFAVGGSFIVDGDPLVFSECDTRVYTFDTDTLVVLPTIAQAWHGNAIRSVSWSTDGAYLASGGDGRTSYGTFALSELKIYGFNQLDVLSTLSATGAYMRYSYASGSVVNSVDWSPVGDYLSVGSAIVGRKVEVHKFIPDADRTIFLFNELIARIAALENAA